LTTEWCILCCEENKIMSNLNRGINARSVLIFCAAAAIILLGRTTATAPRAQSGRSIPSAPTFTVLHSFNYTDGAYPYAGLVQGTDGNLYGTTFGGGCGEKGEGEGCGTIFKMTPGGRLTTFYEFCTQGGNGCPDGVGPSAGLIQGTDGKFYGTAAYGGTGYDNTGGTVFSITAGGRLTTLHSFCSEHQNGNECTDGADPQAGLVQGSDGNFYGTTSHGGSNMGISGGTVFKITPGGMLTTLYSFCSQGGDKCTDGLYPEAGLLQGVNAKFYGTTSTGGTNNDGTVFSITPNGMLTTTHSFCSQSDCRDGFSPQAGLIQDSDGNFYGTTAITVFEITPGGKLRILFHFCPANNTSRPCPDGFELEASLVQGSDGNFYGTTEYGGINGGPCTVGCGTIFRITPSGELTTLYDFCSQNEYECTDGLEPVAGLVQDTNGTFYGTAQAGGTGNLGVVYSLSTGLGPFVVTEPTYGKIGAAVKILGTDLSAATSVSFDGTAATFTVKSKTEITTTVPTGATTGTLQVVTPGGTLSSNVPFRVK
jgi:uncharacterized repeat protein (TIGR03803 family)